MLARWNQEHLWRQRAHENFTFTFFCCGTTTTVCFCLVWNHKVLNVKFHGFYHSSNELLIFSTIFTQKLLSLIAYFLSVVCSKIAFKSSLLFRLHLVVGLSLVLTPALSMSDVPGMDELMEVSFSPIAATGKPLSRCGKCHRFMKYIQVSKPHAYYVRTTWNCAGTQRTFHSHIVILCHCSKVLTLEMMKVPFIHPSVSEPHGELLLDSGLQNSEWTERAPSEPF